MLKSNFYEGSEIFNKFGLKNNGKRIPVRKCDEDFSYRHLVIDDIKSQFDNKFTGEESKKDDQDYPIKMKGEGTLLIFLKKLLTKLN